jgi:hypothetical protein
LRAGEPQAMSQTIGAPIQFCIRDLDISLDHSDIVGTLFRDAFK